jgi:hypothetical protein
VTQLNNQQWRLSDVAFGGAEDLLLQAIGRNPANWKACKEPLNCIGTITRRLQKRYDSTSKLQHTRQDASSGRRSFANGAYCSATVANLIRQTPLDRLKSPSRSIRVTR